MNDTLDLHFRLDPGDLKVPELIERARKTILAISALEVARAGTSAAFWLSAANACVDQAKQLVDIPLADVLVGAWKLHRKFEKYTDTKQFPHGTTSVVPLATHHIKSKHEPYIELSLDGMPAGRIPFELELDLTIEAANLIIQDGQFKRLEAGRARVTGTLKCAGEVVSERTSKNYTWTKGISFGDGIPIAAAA